MKLRNIGKAKPNSRSDKAVRNPGWNKDLETQQQMEEYQDYVDLDWHDSCKEGD